MAGGLVHGQIRPKRGVEDDHPRRRQAIGDRLAALVEGVLRPGRVREKRLEA